MKIKIRSIMNTERQNERRIDVLINNNLAHTQILNQEQIWDLAKQFRELDDELMCIGNDIEM